MALEVEVGSQDLDPAVPCVHDVESIPVIQDKGAGLHEPLLLHTFRAKAKNRAVMLCDVEEERTILDRTVENLDLEAEGSLAVGREPDVVGSIPVVGEGGRDVVSLIVDNLRAHGVPAKLLKYQYYEFIIFFYIFCLINCCFVD